MRKIREIGKSEKPKNMTRRWKLLVAILTTLVAMLVIYGGAVSYTSTPTFCASCHEMKSEFVTFKASAHNQIKCVQCHEQQVTKLKDKNGLIHMSYQHFFEPTKTIVSTVVVPNENCEQCHSRNRLVTATGDIIVNHRTHIEKEIPCITCHSGVVHAKITERGINDSADYRAWTEENVKKLIGDKFEKPNMGTCIDCHVRVNKGEKPWVNQAYSLPAVREEETEGESVVFKETPEMKAGTLERKLPDARQKNILEAVAQQRSDVKLSMECFTCHQKISIPENHNRKNWSGLHGDVAIKELDQCLECHKDSLWLKEVEKQEVLTLLTEPKKKSTFKQDLSTATKESRSNFFCNTCHAYFPASHQDRHTWLYDTHRHNSASPEERKKCFVCHDNQKPKNEKNNAPSDVYCEFCHEGDFPGEPV